MKCCPLNKTAGMLYHAAPWLVLIFRERLYFLRKDIAPSAEIEEM
jgi:hypothetical protein